MTELMLARASSIKYAGKKDKPARLVDTMVRFGVDFLTMTPLTTNQVQGLRMSSTAHWERILACPTDDDDTESSSDESEISVGYDAAAENETLPVHGTDEHTVTVARHVDHLVRCYVSVQTATQVGSFI